MVVGEISDSFSMLHHRVSRGSWGSRCTSGSETAGTRRDITRSDCPSRCCMLLERARNTANHMPTLAARATPVFKHKSRRWRRPRSTPSTELKLQVVASTRAARLYVRCVEVLGCLHRDGCAAQRTMAPIWPHSIAGARTPRALDASITIDRRLLSRHPRGDVGGAAGRDAPAGDGGLCGVGVGDSCWGRGRGLLAQAGLGRP